jgi:hypothetical protein
MTDKITHEQLVNEFIKAIDDDSIIDEHKEPHTWTCPEFEVEYDISTIRARKALDILVEKGVLYRKKVWRVNDWGDRRHVPGYMLTDGFIPTPPQSE